MGVDFDAIEGGGVASEAYAVGGGCDAGDAEVVVLHVGEGDGLDGAGEAALGPGLGERGREVGEVGGCIRGDGSRGGCERGA